jgi:LacI family transcriptional regulator
VDGMVIMDRTIADSTALEVERRGVPVLLLARPSVAEIPSVRVAGAEPTLELTAHLLEHGRRRLAFVGDPTLSPDVQERWSAFVSAHERAGRPTPSAPVATAGYQQHNGREAALAILDVDARSRPDALVCANDQLALGAYQAAMQAGMAVPHDLAVTGWDDDPYAAHLSPPLTTVEQPMYDLGACAAELLFERLDGEDIGDVILTARAVIRHSCGCVEGEDS